jgi:hypothetical protein
MLRKAKAQFSTTLRLSHKLAYYHVSDYAFCCHIDKECANELAGEQCLLCSYENFYIGDSAILQKY